LLTDPAISNSFSASQRDHEADLAKSPPRNPLIESSCSDLNLCSQTRRAS
jgi:hypothetical protein